MVDPLMMLLALPMLLLVVLILFGAALMWGVFRARMWQRAYPWWDLKPPARLRYVLLHILYFFISATIFTVWALVVTDLYTGQPVNVTLAAFVPTWVSAVFLGALLMVPPRAIAYVWHVVELGKRPRRGELTASGGAPSALPSPSAPPNAGSTDNSLTR